MLESKSATRRRNLKIEAIGDYAYAKIKPRIRLSGYWLEQAGFKPGQRAEIHLSKPGELILRSEIKTPASL